MSCRVCRHLCLLCRWGTCTDFVMFLLLLANMIGAQGLRISCVVTKQDFSIAKIVIKYPPRKQKIKSKLHPNHKCCKSEYHPATLSVLECRHSNTRIVPMFKKKSRHTINPPPNRLIRNCPNKRFGGIAFLQHKANSHSKGRSSPKLWTWLSPLRSVELTYRGGACETPPSFHISYRVCRNWHTDRC